MVPVTRADEPVEVVPASAEWAAQARFRRRGSPPWSNVHVVVLDGALWRDNLAFRDFLRTHPDAAAEYAAAKRTAAGRESGLRAYSGAKARTVQELLDRARQWASDASGPSAPAH
jgi:GrpB-like predicted nucleotidyltransferase (UPF0157 family)